MSSPRGSRSNTGFFLSFSEDMAKREYKATSIWLGREASVINAQEASAFGLGRDSRVYRFRRVRCADGVRLAIEWSTIADFALPSELAVESSLYDALDRHGARPVRALQRLRAVSLDFEQTRILDAPVGSPALLIERRGFSADGHLVELTTSRGDAYDFVSEINED